MLVLGSRLEWTKAMRLDLLWVVVLGSTSWISMKRTTDCAYSDGAVGGVYFGWNLSFCRVAC